MTHYVFGEVVIDEARRMVLRRDEELSLRPRGFDLLLHLARAPRQVVTREAFFESVWSDTACETSGC